MKLIVGLGNPGSKYDGTRHNVGFAVIEELARRHPNDGSRVDFEAELAEVTLGESRLLLVQPRTFMNHSGRSVSALQRFYKLPTENLMVVCDDLHLPLGRLRMRSAGSSGGQKGLADILQLLGDERVPRLRLGIGQPPGRIDPSRFVLARFLDEELATIEPSVLDAADAVELWAQHGIDRAMNQINPSPDPSPDEGG